MKLWQWRLSGIMGGLVFGGAVVLTMTACDGGPIGEMADGMRDRAGFDQARQQLLDRHAPQSASLFNGASRPSLEIMHDDTHGVTCWSRKGYQETNLSCLPDWMLTPAQRKPVADACLVKDVGESEACRKLFTEMGAQ